MKAMSQDMENFDQIFQNFVKFVYNDLLLERNKGPKKYFGISNKCYEVSAYYSSDNKYYPALV